MTFKSGLTPVNKIGGPDMGQINPYAIKNGKATAFYSGMLVRVSNGTLDAGTNTDNNLGVLQSVAYIAASDGRPTRTQYLPSGTSSEGGTIDGWDTVNGILAYVYDDPAQEYVIQANTSVFVSAIGRLAQVTAATAGSSYTKRSTARLDISAAGTSAANAAFRIVGCPNFPYNVGYGVSAGQTSEGPLVNTWGINNPFLQVVLVKPLLTL